MKPPLTTALAALLAVAAALLLAPAANPSATIDPPVTIDTTTIDNSANYVGTIDACRSVTIGLGTFNVDIVIQDVDSLSSFDTHLLYNSSVVTIVGKQSTYILPSYPPPIYLFDVGETVPDNDGDFRIVLASSGEGSGSGVIVRLTFQSVADGVSELDLTNVKLGDGNGAPVQTSDAQGNYMGPINDGTIVVGAGTCADYDADGVPNSSDNCALTANPGQEDTVHPGDGGDACQDPDADGIFDSDDNCPDAGNPEQSNADADAFGDACDTGDYDLDKLSDKTEYFCGSPRNNGSAFPERLDGVYAGVTDDGDAQVDEPLPPGSANYDCDGDGYKGAGIGSSEKWVFDATGTANDQDPCGGNSGWPADLVSSGSSLNKITLVDLSSFIAPMPKKLGTSPGAPGYNRRWDLVPGAPAGPEINLVDISSITTLNPPMLGTKAFGGPECPWPP